MIELKGKYNSDCKIFNDNVEDSAIKTIQSILDDEVSKNVPVRIMPDAHDGVDIVIGFTMPLTDRVNPNHIGVDIGCGVRMFTVPKMDIPLSEIDERIQKVIPMGFKHRITPCECEYTRPLCDEIGQDYDSVCRQLGTLGGGNHFIELGEREGMWYFFIHTGSRNFGLQVAKYHSKKAKDKGSSYLFGKDGQDYLWDME